VVVVIKTSYGKVKVKLFLCFNWAPCHEGVFLTLELDVGEWSVSRPCCFVPRNRAPVIHWIRGWVGPRASLKCSGVEKNSQPLSQLKPLIIQLIGQCYATKLSQLLYSLSTFGLKKYYRKIQQGSYSCKCSSSHHSNAPFLLLGNFNLYHKLLKLTILNQRDFQ